MIGKPEDDWLLIHRDALVLAALVTLVAGVVIGFLVGVAVLI